MLSRELLNTRVGHFKLKHALLLWGFNIALITCMGLLFSVMFLFILPLFLICLSETYRQVKRNLSR